MMQEKMANLEEPAASLVAGGLTLRLHDLADLDARVEKFGGAAVEADGFALVELALAVVCGDALLLAHGLESVVCVGHHSHLALDSSNLLL